MYKKIFLILLLTVFLAALPQKAFAALYINEFSSNSDPEWVEIYNSSSSSVDDLSSYTLSDLDGHKMSLSGSIDGNGFASFDWGNNTLNNDSGTISLLVKTEGGNDSSVDQVKYGSGGLVAAPGNGQSAGRKPNGSSTFAVFSNITKKGSNDLAGTVSPTSAPTSAPGSSPTPIKTPTPTVKPSPTPTNTPTPTPTPLPTNTPTPTRTPPGSDLELASDIGNEPLGQVTKVPAEGAGVVLGISTTQSPLLFVFLGLIFLIVCGILAFFQFGDQIMARLRKLRNKE